MVESKSKDLTIEELIRLKTPDLVFVIDATGSMESYIEAIKDSLCKLLSELSVIPETDEMFYGAVFYRDFCDGEKRFEVIDIEQISRYYKDPENEKIPKLITRLEEMRNECNGGGDNCEDVSGGLKMAMGKDSHKGVKISWGSKYKLICHVADAPAHGSKFNGGCNDDHETDNSVGEIVKSLAKENFYFMALEFNKSTKVMFDEFLKIYQEVGRERRFRRFDFISEDKKSLAEKIAEAIKITSLSL